MGKLAGIIPGAESLGLQRPLKPIDTCDSATRAICKQFDPIEEGRRLAIDYHANQSLAETLLIHPSASLN